MTKLPISHLTCMYSTISNIVMIFRASTQGIVTRDGDGSSLLLSWRVPASAKNSVLIARCLSVMRHGLGLVLVPPVQGRGRGEARGSPLGNSVSGIATAAWWLGMNEECPVVPWANGMREGQARRRKGADCDDASGFERLDLFSEQYSILTIICDMYTYVPSRSLVTLESYSRRRWLGGGSWGYPPLHK